MRRNAMRKNLRQSILTSLGRYLAIVAIIALGASMFVGLLMTKSDMVATGQRHMDELNMFDLRLLNSYGWTQEHVDAVEQMPGVVDVEGIRYTDLIIRRNDSTDDLVYRFYAMPDSMNMLSLRGGRMPEAPDECLVDGYHVSDSVLGSTITVSSTNFEDSADALLYDTFTVVGYFASPLYMDMNRGTTSVGSGSLSNYVYIPQESFDLDYYAEINVTIPGDYAIYSDAYNDAMEAAADVLKPLLQPYADERLAEVKTEAKTEYRKGLKEYEDGLKEFEEGKLEAEQELEDAYQKLLDAEQEIADNEARIASGEQQLAAAKAQIAAAEQELISGRQQFNALKVSLIEPISTAESALRASYESAKLQLDVLDAQIAAKETEIDAKTEGISNELEQINDLNSRITSLKYRISAIDGQIQAAQALRSVLNLLPSQNEQIITQLDASIASLNQERSGLAAELAELESQLEEVRSGISGTLGEIEALQEELDALESERETLQLTISGMETSLGGIAAAWEEVKATIAESEAELLAGEQQIAAAKAQIAYQEQQLISGKAQLEEGKLELDQAWLDYEEGVAEFEREIAEAELELADARQQLDDALQMIVKMRTNDVIVLDRNTNIGYNSLDSASDIVSGVSRVFPAFFLLVASLVCITTMTRMIDEERTQIGTLKALGYSNGAIISKYLVYAGSGAIIGCGFGVLLGSAVFPVILWQAYKIMLYITDDIVLQINWWLCGAVVGTYTLVMLLVTWYCCRRTLKEVPAELIRPKAPDTGKKILMERLPFWNKISFLNKVTIRNIFRYRQRLAMMMVGIGGCTALLVTGFGLRDSIVNVVDYQFEDVTVYDMSVNFSNGRTEEEQAQFIKDISFGVENTMFYYQASMDLEFDSKTKEIYLIAADAGVTEFIDLHTGDVRLDMPKVNEVVISVGAAEAMGIDIGDEILMRNSEMQMLHLTVSGIYDNHVYNYAIILPETITEQWGEVPGKQMAFVKVKDGQDVHELSAEITGMSNVMNVSISEDLANMVGNMMDALDLVVIVIVICAGALAVIVLYNLTNININERIREIATIKVLGFNAKETAAYVFKENMSLTVIGSAVGLGLGYLLLLFVMSQIRIDMVYFKAVVMPLSYVLSIVLTILAACFVCFIFYFKLDKINMAEALKSVE